MLTFLTPSSKSSDKVVTLGGGCVVVTFVRAGFGVEGTGVTWWTGCDAVLVVASAIGLATTCFAAAGRERPEA
jgi:hypothetical protein